LSSDVTINDQVAIAFNANDEEFAITGTATNQTAAGLMTLIMAAQDATKHILILQQTPDADEHNEYLLLEDNAGDDKFEIEEGGTTTWTLDAASIVKIDGTTTANTSTGGVLDIDVESATNTNKAISLTYELEESASAAYGIYIDLDDDTTGAGETFNAIYICNASGAGSADAVKGVVFANTLDDCLDATLGAGGQFAVIDAATTDNTGTAGVIDIAYDTATNGASLINIDAGHGNCGDGETTHVIYIDMDDDDTADASTYNGITLNASDVDGGAVVQAIYVQSADCALQADKGYIRVGTGETPSETLNDDDIYTEGTIEADGKIYADAGIELDNSLLNIATIEITNNELEAIRGTPKELVAAQGAGILIEFVSAIIIYDYSGDTLAETDDNLAIEYDGGSAAAVSETIEMTNFIDQGSDQITRAVPVKDAMDAAADVVNKNIVLVNTGDGEFVDGGSDCTSTMTVIVTYKIHDTLGL